MMRAVLLGAVAFLLATGCEPKRTIPARAQAGEASSDSIERWLTGGKLVIEENFKGNNAVKNWALHGEGDWRVEGGWLRSERALNKGAWLKTLLPEGPVRVEFKAKSAALRNGKPFPGDLKCEIFAQKPEHEGGYVIINGGWGNKLDVIARLDEHGKDRLAQGALLVSQDKVHRWAVVRDDKGSVIFFRDGTHVMTYPDSKPVNGRYFGFNNWETNVSFADLKVYKL